MSQRPCTGYRLHQDTSDDCPCRQLSHEELITMCRRRYTEIRQASAVMQRLYQATTLPGLGEEVAFLRLQMTIFEAAFAAIGEQL